MNKTIHSTLFSALAIASPLSTAVHAEDAPKTGWTSTATAGVSLTKGNSDTLLATANVNTGKKWGQNEISLGAAGAYGENTVKKATTVNTESASAFAQYNRLFSERFYGFGHVDGLWDSISDIDYRFTLAPGAGYYILKAERQNLSVEAGPGLVFERVGGKESSYFTLRVAEKYDLKINDRARLWQRAEFLPQVDKLANYVINFEIGVDTDITKNTALTVFLQDSYRSKPAGSLKHNDIKLVSGIKYKF